jgi:hypothetical protein
MPTFPAGKQTLQNPTNQNPDGSGGSVIDAALPTTQNQLLEAMQDYFGTAADVATSVGVGSLVSRVLNLESKLIQVTFSAAAPTVPTPVANDVWIETDVTPWVIRYYTGAAWITLGADAIAVNGRAVDLADTPADGDVLAWDNAAQKLVWAAQSGGGFTNPMIDAGDMIRGGTAGAPTRLVIGAAGDVLIVENGIPTWKTSPYIPAPGSPTQGDVIYFNGTTWARLAPGTDGYFLKTHGAGANPEWAAQAANPPGGGIVSPVGAGAGDMLAHNGSDWVLLENGTSGQFLRSNGAAMPTWGTPASGFTNPMTGIGDVIIGSTGGAAIRLAPGSNGQVLKLVSGSPAWAAESGGNPMTTVNDLIKGGASGVMTRLAAGSEAQVLTIVGGAVAWANAASGFSNPMTTAGDLIRGGSGGAATRLAIGSEGQVLKVVSGAPAWGTDETGGGGGAGISTMRGLLMLGA